MNIKVGDKVTCTRHCILGDCDDDFEGYTVLKVNMVDGKFESLELNLDDGVVVMVPWDLIDEVLDNNAKQKRIQNEERLSENGRKVQCSEIEDFIYTYGVDFEYVIEKIERNGHCTISFFNKNDVLVAIANSSSFVCDDTTDCGRSTDSCGLDLSNCNIEIYSNGKIERKKFVDDEYDSYNGSSFIYHNLEGPAVEYPNSPEKNEYWLNGKQIENKRILMWANQIK